MTENYYKTREYLSFSSIDTMIKDPKRWYQEKIKKNRDEIFKTYFVRGSAVHAVIEHYNKTWEINKDIWYSMIMAKVAEEKDKGRDVSQKDMEDTTIQFECAVDNYFSTNPPRAKEAEYETRAKLIPTREMYYMGKIDAITEDALEDYKVKGKLTNLEYPNDKDDETLAKYKRQAHFYLLSYEIETWKKLSKVVFKEIMTKVPDLLKCRKPTIIKMAQEKGIKEPIGTIAHMVEAYDLKPVVTQDVIIQRDDKFMGLVLDQFNTACNLYDATKTIGEKMLLYSMDRLYD